MEGRAKSRMTAKAETGKIKAVPARAAWRNAASRVFAGAKLVFPDFWLRRRVGRGAGIFTYTPSRERLMIYEEASLALKLERFLEVGSHLGASAVVLAEVLKRKGSQCDRHVYCVDTWQNDAM